MDTAEGLIECKARGRFRKTVGKPIVGDRVTLEIQPEDGTGYLLDIAPVSYTHLGGACTRRDSTGRRQTHEERGFPARPCGGESNRFGRIKGVNYALFWLLRHRYVLYRAGGSVHYSGILGAEQGQKMCIRDRHRHQRRHAAVCGRDARNPAAHAQRGCGGRDFRPPAGDAGKLNWKEKGV